ncbi:unnamed protein product [Allacma fusca]|uniref:Ig-like domain-containing protein n=1 Tax=Allacma fusca TaxID=39272 RepID=A0A8J2JS54_9HEXA|nr:unnamed protein product [Allacma fusca]
MNTEITTFFSGKEPSGLYLGPYFDSDKNNANITSYVGTNAYLPCYVKQLGNKSVSWIRSSDAHIVTVDRYTFIADDRFLVIPLGESWTLQIKYVQPRDAGYYECQISTSPKLAFRTHLHVLVPKIRMSGAEQNIFVWEGSEVELRCSVENGRSDQLEKLQWQKNEDILHESPIHNYIVFRNKLEGSSLITTATFPNVHRQDSGNYTCALENVGSASVTLHVLNGENPAAMQHGYGKLLPSAASQTFPFQSWWTTAFPSLNAFMVCSEASYLKINKDWNVSRKRVSS